MNSPNKTRAAILVIRSPLLRPLLAVALACMVALLGCGSQYDADVEPGPHGEVGADLTKAYDKEFLVSRASYFAALERIYSFAHRKRFDRFRTEDCFGDVVDWQPMELPKACLALWAVIGAPTKAHITFSVEQKSFNRLDGNNHVRYRIGIYVFKGIQHAEAIGPAFQSEVEPDLLALDRFVREKQVTR